MTFRNLLVALAAGSLLMLAGCGGSSTPADPPTAMPDPDPEPSAYETAKAAIAAATTAAAAQAAYDAVEDDVTAAQGRMLQEAVDMRVAALAAMGRASDQRAALMMAAGAIDTSDLTDADDIAAANRAIAALKAAIAAADDVDDTSMYDAQVTAAETLVKAAQGRLDHAAQTSVLSDAVGGLQAIDLTDLSTQDKIDAAQDAIDALQTALDGATELSDAEKTAAMTELATADRTVMMAQGRFDTAAQKKALADAVATLAALNLDNLMTQEDIDAAVAAITGLNLALEAATSLTDADKLDATVDATVAQRKVDRAETDLAENVGDQRMTLTDAGKALADLNLDDLDTQEKIDAADAAAKALKAALDGATHLSDSEKAAYETQLSTATETVRTAQTGMDRDGRMTAQRSAITNAVTMARTAVAGVDDDSTDTEVGAADSAIAALEKAIADAADLPEGDAQVAMARGTLATLEPQLAAAKRSRTAAIAKRDEERDEEMAELGEAMHDALGPPDTATTTALDNAAVTLSATGLAVDAAVGAGALATGADPDSVTLQAGDSRGSLDGWAGTDYAHTNTGTKVVNEARVYNNKGPGESEPFADAGYSVHTGDTSGTDIKDHVYIAAGGSAQSGFSFDDVEAVAFTHSGEQHHPYDADRVVAFTTRGTYDGAPGEYRCTGTCTSTNDGEGSPSALGGTWHFKPDPNAMVHQPDDDYLYYGWWVSKDEDGMPTAASAFRGAVGTAPAATGTPILLSDGVALAGSATYVGKAAGKFAMDNPLDGTGNGGHFTANAVLTAKFGANAAPNNGGVSGIIDTFRLNDGSEDPGWRVVLHRGEWGTTGAFTSTSDVANTTADGTTWSINGNAAPESGIWSGQMYDEMPGNAPDGDGSNVPTTATGTFYSEFSTIGRMVGAFGADKKKE